MPPRPRATDADLIQAARDALAEHGFAGATLERIAEQAGVSRVTLHRRGISREGLLAELVARATEDYRSALWPALTGEGSGAERLEQALSALCESTERYLPVLVALQARTDRIFHRPEEEGEEDGAMTRSVFTEPLERLLRDGIADGSLRTADPVETATVLFNLVGWTYVHLRTGHGWSPQRAREGTLQIALHGVASA